MSLLTILFVVGGIEFVFCPLFLAFIWATHRKGICPKCRSLISVSDIVFVPGEWRRICKKCSKEIELVLRQKIA